MATTESTDMGIGLAALLSSLVVVAAIALYLSANKLTSGWAFAAAVVAAAIAVVAVHAYADG